MPLQTQDWRDRTVSYQTEDFPSPQCSACGIPEAGHWSGSSDQTATGGWNWHADLLIVDELGYLSFSRGGAELLFQVFADRYERRSQCLNTTQLPVVKSFPPSGSVFRAEVGPICKPISSRLPLLRNSSQADLVRSGVPENVHSRTTWQNKSRWHLSFVLLRNPVCSGCATQLG